MVLDLSGLPGDSHRATKGIDAKTHVICEKPLSTTLDSARELERRARDAGVVATVQKRRTRYSPFAVS